jgi:hypothetical protein
MILLLGMNTRLLKSVIIYGIGALSSNLLASTRDRDCKVMKFSCEIIISPEAKTLDDYEQLALAIVAENLEEKEKVFQIEVQCLCDNLEGVDANTIEAWKFWLKRKALLERKKALLIKRKTSSIKQKALLEKFESEFDAQNGWTQENEELIEKTGKCLNEGFLRDPERRCKVLRSIADILFERGDISENDRGLMVFKSMQVFLLVQGQEFETEEDHENHCVKLKYTVKE